MTKPTKLTEILKDLQLTWTYVHVGPQKAMENEAETYRIKAESAIKAYYLAKLPKQYKSGEYVPKNDLPYSYGYNQAITDMERAINEE